MLPVYNYVQMTERLSAARLRCARLGEPSGAADGGNQFHYFRLTADDRILYGGYDAIYHWRNGVGGHLDERHDTSSVLAEHLVDDVPAARGDPLHAPLGRCDRHL